LGCGLNSQPFAYQYLLTVPCEQAVGEIRGPRTYRTQDRDPWPVPAFFGLRRTDYGPRFLPRGTLTQVAKLKRTNKGTKRKGTGAHTCSPRLQPTRPTPA